MEFYKEYVDDCFGDDGSSATKKLNEDVKNNPQWKSEVQGYSVYDDIACILVRWVGLSSTEFTEVHYG